MLDYGRNEYYILPLISERNVLSKELRQYCNDEKICVCYFISIICKIFSR
ncbi:MAG: hypothetical protein ACRC7N_11605 [Clostridium sp.]